MRSNYVLQRPPGTFLVSSELRGPAPLNTALDHMGMPRDLRALWELSNGDPTVSDTATHAFDDAGLIWIAPVRNFGSDVTPLNCVTFAATGGDSVHYSWLELPGRDADSAPIVMTVPCAGDGRQNIVVGESLRDFLNLGCRYGYFALEQLAYDWHGTIKELEKKSIDPDAWPDKIARLEQLTTHFALEPWERPGEKLTQLQRQYGHFAIVGARHRAANNLRSQALAAV